MLRHVAPMNEVVVLRLFFVREGEEKYMLLKLASTADATTAMVALNSVTLTSASRPLRARYARSRPYWTANNTAP